MTVTRVALMGNLLDQCHPGVTLRTRPYGLDNTRRYGTVTRVSMRDEWIEIGLRVLAADGEPGLRIDRLAERLGRSKGSFHHHFRGAADYRRALLERYEQLAVGDLDDAIRGLGDKPPARVFAALTDRMSSAPDSLWDPGLEIAVRAWSFADPAARVIQERVDRARYDRMLTQWRRLTDDDERARTAARLPFLVAVGASVALPTPTPDELRAVYTMLSEFLAVGAGSADAPPRNEGAALG